MNTLSLFAKRKSRLIICLVLAAALLGPLASPQKARAGGPYTVNISYDGPDSNLSDGICYDGVAGCTLRAAIQQASHDGVTTTINFDSSLSGIFLYLSNSYGPLIVSGNFITIDGSTGGYPPLIDGSNLLGAKNVFEVQGNYNTIENLVVRGGTANGIYVHDPSASGYASYNNLNQLFIYDNAQDGVLIVGDAGGGGFDNTISNSLIGVANYAQTTCPGDGNGWEGIALANDTHATNIMSNEIACNGNSGIWLNGGSGGLISGTMIQGNNIGTNGTAHMGNGLTGITATKEDGTTIYNNVISGNGHEGIWLQGSSNATVTDNRLGVDQTKVTALPNGYAGIAITDGAYNNQIGSPTDVSLRNIISGNSQCGVNINSGAYNNVLDGNYIGLGGTDGMVVVANDLAGVCFDNASNNALSTSTATVKQYVSGNAREGIYAINSDALIVNNATWIGLAGNDSNPAGNNREGIKLDAGTTNAIILPGKVMYNAFAGIAVLGNSSLGNEIAPGQVGYNTGMAIDLGDDGFTANGTQLLPGPNNWMNYPAITGSTGRQIHGITCAGCTIFIYRATGDPTADGGGGIYLSFVIANGSGVFNYTVPAGVPAVTTVACDTSRDCSELSPKYTLGFNIFLPFIRR